MNAPDSILTAEPRRWNEHYLAEASFFGDEPSPLLVEALRRLRPEPPRALCFGEAEGRNALYLARRGFVVTAIDGAPAGLDELRARARQQRLHVSTLDVDPAWYIPPARSLGLVTSFYCHLDPEVRRAVVGRAARALGDEGALVIEGFDRRQRLRGRAPGAAVDLSLLYDAGEIRRELAAWFDDVRVEPVTTPIRDGRHSGEADLVRAVARRPRTR
jgi:hypothetical protein